MAETPTVPCISCRLRRKKCDRLQPICSRCQRLGIPEEWCLYKDGVGLQEKDSRATLHREQLLNQEAKRRHEHIRLLLSLAKRSERLTRKGHQRIFHAGVMQSRYNDKKLVPEVPDLEAYMGSISLMASTESHEQDTSVVATVLEILSQERQRYEIEKMPKLKDRQQALLLFEDQCLASLVGAGECNAETLIQGLLREIIPMVPTESYYRFLWQHTRTQNSSRYVIGLPHLSEPDIFRVETIIKFDQNGQPYLEDDIARNGEKLVYLSISLMYIAMSYFIRSKRLSSDFSDTLPGNTQPSSYGLCLRYAGALLKVPQLDRSLDLDGNGLSTLYTLALHQYHLMSRYTAATSFKSQFDNPQSTALYTRYLISRCKAHHFHEDLENFYPDITEEQGMTYKSIWYSLGILEIMDTLDLGFTSSFRATLFSLESPFATRNPITVAIRLIHEVVDDINMCDGELTVDLMLELVSDRVKKLQEASENLGRDVFEDMKIFGSVNTEAVKADPTVVNEFYKAYERVLMRILIYGVIQSIHSMVTLGLEKAGETAQNSERALVHRLLSIKYSLLSLQYNGALFTTIHRIGEDLTNHVGQITMLAGLHFGMAFESVGTRRALLWVNTLTRAQIKLKNDKIVNFMMYHKDEVDKDKVIVRLLEQSGYFDDVPTLEELLDLKIDYDHKKIIERYSKMNDAAKLMAIVAKAVDVAKAALSPAGLNLAFVKMTKVYALSSRYTCFGLRYFFPHVAQEAESSTTPTPKPGRHPSEGSEVDFAGTFRELFEQEIDTSAPKEFDFGAFFGVDYEKYLWESWEDSVHHTYDGPMGFP